MATPTDTVWEVRTSGASTNSGGFAASLGGTDYSRQNSPQYSVTDLAIDGADNTKVTSASHTFVSADVGNTIRFTAGVNFTQAVYMILSVSAGAAILDRACGTAGATAGSASVGGAFNSLATMFAVNALLFLAGNTIYVKGGSSYSLAAGASSSKAGTRAARIALIGYTSSRGDNGQVTLSGSGSFTALLTISGAYWDVRNLYFQSSGTTDYGLQAAAGQAWIENCLCTGARTRGFYVGADGTVARNCSADSCGIVTGTTTGGGFYWISGSGLQCQACTATNCYIGFNNNASSPAYSWCLSANNTKDGFLYQGQCSPLLTNCTIRNNGQDGVRMQDASTGEAPSIVNCLFWTNAGYSINSVVTNYGNNYLYARRFQNNAFRLADNGAANVGTGDVNEILLTVNPFVNSFYAATNGLAGGGADVRNVGWPGALSGTTDVGYPDIGCYQAPPTISLSRVYGGY